MVERPQIAKWYSTTEYYNEEGERIRATDARKNYIIINTIKNIKINGTTGTITYWKICARDRQIRLFK